MRILIAHNFYEQSGGEDAVFYSEAALLEQHGHAPLRYVLHNRQMSTCPNSTRRQDDLESPGVSRNGQLVRGIRGSMSFIFTTRFR